MVENTGKDKVFNRLVYAGLFVYIFATALPLLHVLANALSSPEMVNKGKVGLWPRQLNFSGFGQVLADSDILRGFLMTFVYTLLGTLLQLVLQFTAAYSLSRRDLPFKRFWIFFFLIPMFVSGGMIPTYLIVKGLRLMNTFLAMIIPGCVGIYNIVIIRTYMGTAIPWELQEAARIDGASNLRIFLFIVMPLATPILAVMTLYGIVGYWNSYFNALLYLTNRKLYPLQMVLQKILVANAGATVGGSIGNSEQQLKSESLKYVVMVVSCAPILFLYPFFQRFFEKGLMIGGLKG
ncbi:MAG: carbohydrate ABC transporter permease [Clostridiales bacterium]|jgi:putative aldouronate transport system permease protein|nr:carbohydrate ABC transporter permease [Clostridiales bacterium]